MVAAHVEGRPRPQTMDSVGVPVIDSVCSKRVGTTAIHAGVQVHRSKLMLYNEGLFATAAQHSTDRATAKVIKNASRWGAALLCSRGTQQAVTTQGRLLESYIVDFAPCKTYIRGIQDSCPIGTTLELPPLLDPPWSYHTCPLTRLPTRQCTLNAREGNPCCAPDGTV